MEVEVGRPGGTGEGLTARGSVHAGEVASRKREVACPPGRFVV